MPILFSVVARGTIVLAKYATCAGNFTEVTEQILSKIPPHDDKLTYSHGNYLFHYIAENKLVFFCITDDVSITHSVHTICIYLEYRTTYWTLIFRNSNVQEHSYSLMRLKEDLRRPSGTRRRQLYLMQWMENLQESLPPRWNTTVTQKTLTPYRGSMGSWMNLRISWWKISVSFSIFLSCIIFVSILKVYLNMSLWVTIILFFFCYMMLTIKIQPKLLLCLFVVPI